MSSITTNALKPSASRMIVPFSKMHGLGNDFLVIDGITQAYLFEIAQLKRLSHRNLGVGCDQIILIEAPRHPDADFYYQIYNQDGSEALQCGNGACCAARFVFERGLINKQDMVADCQGGRVFLNLHETAPWTQLSLRTPPTSFSQETIQLEQDTFDIFCLDVGNPHGICFLLAHQLPSWPRLAPKISHALGKPCGINLTAVVIENPHKAQLSVVERGVGPTLACGSAAMASFIVARLLGKLEPQASLDFALGSVEVNWLGATYPLHYRIRTEHVFLGQYKL